MEKECSCRGMNANCSRCGGSGIRVVSVDPMLLSLERQQKERSVIADYVEGEVPGEIIRLRNGKKFRQVHTFVMNDGKYCYTVSEIEPV
jgi:hypothetical protein